MSEPLWERVYVRPEDPKSPVLNVFSKARTLEFFHQAELKAAKSAPAKDSTP